MHDISIPAAVAALKGVVTRTPVLTSQALNNELGAEVSFKCENLQQTGAFKFRGAYFALSRFDDDQRRRGVATYSSGNHAKAIARAAKMLGIKAVIVMPTDAPHVKVEATRADGAEIIFYDRYAGDRAAIIAEVVRDRGMTLIPPFDHPDIIAGQGTAAWELFEEVGELDQLYVCVGGGGLISGSILAAQEKCPGCEVIGVEPEAGNDVQQSLAKGSIVEIPVPRTIADGAQTTAAGRLTFSIIQANVNRILTVSDEELIQQMRWYAGEMKLVVEPTGCLAAAGLKKGGAIQGKRIGVIVSGGNVDPNQYASWLAN